MLSIKQENSTVDYGTDDHGLAAYTHYLQNPNERVLREAAIEYLKSKEAHPSKLESDEIYCNRLFDFKRDAVFPEPLEPDFKFIDLFAGIGGFRLALQNVGGKCVFSSEWNKAAQQTYDVNFGEVPFGDITVESTKSFIPDNFDVLCAGFPCQPFSISGKMKGFEDTRGTLIYDVFQIIERKRPAVVFLENVKHLRYHDKGNTLKTILQGLRNLGYFTEWSVLNASNFGVPQNRERIIIIATLKRPFDFSNLVKEKPKPKLRDFLDKTGVFEYLEEPYTILEDIKVQKSGLMFAGYRNKKIRKAGVREGTEHLSRVHKQPNRIYSIEGVHPALPSQESSGRFFIWDKTEVRKLTIGECFRIMGFPEEYKRPSSLGEQYRQVGNSVCVPMIGAIMEQIKKQKLV